MSRRGRSGASWWRPVLVIVLPVLISTGAAVTVLIRLLAPSSAQDRLDTVRTGLAIGAGIGALITLALALRRQQATEHDATERRLTELYVKAVDQLGSDKPAVRQGGLYALERVAQDNPAHRQTIVEVICAYLRAPYTPPTDTPTRKLTGLRAPLRPGRTRPRPPRSTPSGTLPTSTGNETHQELQVRLTAQRILRNHLAPHRPARTPLRWFPRPAPTFWPNIDLDLTGATLIDLDLQRTAIRAAQFRGAKLTGTAQFNGARFDDITEFSEAWFDGTAQFIGARFDDIAAFNGTRFDDIAQFNGTWFVNAAQFSEARFDGTANFSETRFDDIGEFDGARFARTARFCGTRFRSAWFSGTQFGQTAWFDNARFSSIEFSGADFDAGADFDKAQFSGIIPQEVQPYLRAHQDPSADIDPGPR